MKPVMISLCDESGIMAEPWAEAGYLCLCVDIKHSIRRTKSGKYEIRKYEGGGEIHFIYGDARSWKPSNWKADFFNHYQIVFVACFPVCTNLSGSGSQDWKQKGLGMLTDGLILFNACETVAAWSGAPYCVENPVGAITKHHREPDYIFDPWFYGEAYQKKTCLWTGNGFIMPPRTVWGKPETVTQKIWEEPPGEKRAEIRSKTPALFAKAVFESNQKIDKV